MIWQASSISHGCKHEEVGALDRSGKQRRERARHLNVFFKLTT
jgi:hypothetical protein